MVAARTPNIIRSPDAVRTSSDKKSLPAKRPAPSRKGARASWQSKLRADLQPEVVRDHRRGPAPPVRRGLGLRAVGRHGAARGAGTARRGAGSSPSIETSVPPLGPVYTVGASARHLHPSNSSRPLAGEGDGASVVTHFHQAC